MCVVCYNDKTTSNQQTTRDKLVPIRVVFEGIISRFWMTYKQNEHKTNDKQLEVFRDTCPFYMFIKSKREVWDQNKGCR
jgi:hypothetical protein